MPYTQKQRSAAFAELSRRNEGKKPKTFKGMSETQLRDWAHSPIEPTKKESKKNKK